MSISKTKTVAVPNADALQAENESLREEIRWLKVEKEDLEKQVDDIKTRAESEAHDQIADFLAECERPAGSLRFIVPQTPAVERALLRLSDAVTTQEGLPL